QVGGAPVLGGGAEFRGTVTFRCPPGIPVPFLFPVCDLLCLTDSTGPRVNKVWTLNNPGGGLVNVTAIWDRPAGATTLTLTGSTFTLFGQNVPGWTILPL